MQRAYLFEAKGIQRWLLSGGKLRDIATASAVLSSMARSDGKDILKEVMATAGFKPRLSRRAGGAFVLHFDDNAAETAAFDRFRGLWRLTFMRIAPGLGFSEGLGEGTDEREAAKLAYSEDGRRAASRQNTSASVLPLGPPLAALAQRTGLPVVQVGGKFDPAKEGLDVDLLARRKCEVALEGTGVNSLRDVTAEVLRERFEDDVIWPNQMEMNNHWDKGVLFPFRSGEADRRIAIIHADISALGQTYKAIRDAEGATIDSLRAAAEAIERATAAAAAEAAKECLEPNVEAGVVPARPVLIGGDDITLIVRADLALKFTHAFLRALETNTKENLQRVCRECRLGDAPTLTAAAGVAIGGAKQPFFRLLELAESLCNYAKNRAKKVAGDQRPRSVLAFHRTTESALASSAGELFARVATSHGELTAQPYRVGEAGVGDLRKLADLEAVVSALRHEALAPGGLRAIRSDLLQATSDPSKFELAEEAWRRWRKMATRRPEGAAALKALDSALTPHESGLDAPDDKPKDISLKDGVLKTGATPLFDALEWMGLE